MPSNLEIWVRTLDDDSYSIDDQAYKISQDLGEIYGKIRKFIAAKREGFPYAQYPAIQELMKAQELPSIQEESKDKILYLEDLPQETYEQSTNILREKLLEILNDGFTEREKEVIIRQHCFGMNNEEIREEFDVSRERIRQIGNKALRKLRRHPGVEQLRDFYEN
jgi:RNA polymerase sigma factor (sigma-70 family)